MVDFVLGRLKFVYKGNWATSTAYIKDDIVTYGGRTYVCVTNHTSSATAAGGFYTNSANWNLIADGIQNKGDWVTGTYYKVNDIVKWGANIYICSTGHTAGTNWVDTEANFTIFIGGLEFEDTWSSSTLYQPGDIVRYGGYQFVATNESTNILPTNTSYWDVLSIGFNMMGAYAGGTAYKPGDVVNYGAYTYVAKSNTTGNLPTNTSYWDLVVTGSVFRGAYAGGTGYRAGDVVTYGAYSYIALQDTTGNLPTNATYWTALNTGMRLLGTYAPGTLYTAGDTVTYGGYAYTAVQNTIGNAPSNVTYWSRLTAGMSFTGEYSNSTAYKPGEVVKYGGHLYITAVDTSPGTKPSNTSVWSIYNNGIKWNNTWSNTTSYQVGDAATYSGTTYVSVAYDNLNNTPDPGSNTFWQLVAQGSTSNLNLTTVGDTLFYNVSGLDRLPVGSNGSIIVSNGTVPTWGNPGISANCYYVSPNGVDAAGYGDTIQKPFRTIKYASQQVSGLSTIFVKTGTYEEQLPIVVPTGVSVVGEAMRTTIVKPLVGVLSDDAVNNNENSTMWQLSDGTVLTQMTFSGMTGFVAPSSPNENDITQATIKGVVLAFNPASPINHKSPYIVYCSSINTRGIGALVDGSVHASGNKSMLFHSYTNIQDGGVGIYAKDNGKAEVVSCFTYFCHMGYAASGGGKVRSLNGNHSYGIYGSVARGFDTTEISTNGYIYGEMLTLNSNAVNYNVGETIVGALSGAQGTVTAVQSSVGQVYYYRTTANTFTTDELVTGSGTGYAANTLSSNSVTGQGNYVLVVSGLPKLPAAGQSLEIVGDSNSYIVQTVSGSYANTSSVITIILTAQKVTASSNGAVVRIRNGFSNIRLTGHDFLNIGVGNTQVSAYPNVNTALTIQANETVAINPGRVYYTSTDQDGNFRVGQYFAVNQATGAATLNASAFNLSGLTSLRLGSIGAQVGALISEFSTDGKLSANSDSKVPTQQATKTYVDTIVAATASQTILDDISGLFNGTTRTFTLTFSNSTVTSANAIVTSPYALDLKLGDVRVYPTNMKSIITEDLTNYTEFGLSYRFQDGYYLTGTTNNVITFYKAPLPGMSFYAKITGENVPTYSFDPTAKTPFRPLNIMFT